jgi:hypothetical protein
MLSEASFQQCHEGKVYVSYASRSYCPFLNIEGEISERISKTSGHSPLNLIKPSRSVNGQQKCSRHFVFYEASQATTVVGCETEKYIVGISIPFCCEETVPPPTPEKYRGKVTHFFLALRLHNIEYNLVIAHHHHQIGFRVK